MGSIDIAADDEGEGIILERAFAGGGGDEFAIEIEARFVAIVDAGDVVPGVGGEDGRGAGDLEVTASDEDDEFRASIGDEQSVSRALGFGDDWKKALEKVKQLSQNQSFDDYLLYHSLLGEIHKRLGNKDLASTFYEKGLKMAESEQEKKLLRDKISELF